MIGKGKDKRDRTRIAVFIVEVEPGIYRTRIWQGSNRTLQLSGNWTLAKYLVADFLERLPR